MGVLFPEPEICIGKSAKGRIGAFMDAHIGIAGPAIINHSIAVTVVDNRAVNILSGPTAVVADNTLT